VIESMEHWNGNQVCVIDTETTGLSKKDEIVEIAAMKITDGKPNGTYHSYIIPTIPVPPVVVKIHGLDNEFLKKNGNQAVQALGGFLLGATLTGVVLGL